MKKSSKVLIIVIAAALSVIVLSFIAVRALKRFSRPDKYKIEEAFTANIDAFETVAEYMRALDRDSCFIESDNGQIKSIYGEVPVENEEVVEAVKRLWQIGCHLISKYADYNSIKFELWSNMFGIDSGVLYVIDDNEAPSVQYMTGLEETQFAKWFYYAADYEEWRLKN